MKYDASLVELEAKCKYFVHLSSQVLELLDNLFCLPFVFAFVLFFFFIGPIYHVGLS